jgi:hypothetical protein
MRIAVLFHAKHTPEDVGSRHAIGLIAELWRQEGHEVRFLIGCREHWDADVVILHVDMSVVANRYVKFVRRYPVVINGRILDIRKSKISRNLLEWDSKYEGRVIVKTDLNSAGKPERALSTNRLWQRVRRRLRFNGAAKGPLPKNYSVYASIRHIPAKALAAPGLVIEKFRPETDGEWYFVRRSFICGDRVISYRIGAKQPIVDTPLPGAFEWIENSSEVLAVSRELGLDYGTIDYTTNGEEVAVFDVNKTPGRARPPDDAAVRDYEKILRSISSGIYKFVAGYDGQVLSFARGGNGSNYPRSGWSQAEDWGVWSDGPIATVLLTDVALAGKGNVELVIEARGFVYQGQPKQRVRVRVNGADAGELLRGWDITSTSLQVPAEALKSSLLQIELVPETPMSPATSGISFDKRLLGIGLKSLQLREVKQRREARSIC